MQPKWPTFTNAHKTSKQNRLINHWVISASGTSEQVMLLMSLDGTYHHNFLLYICTQSHIFDIFGAKWDFSLNKKKEKKKEKKKGGEKGHVINSHVILCSLSSRIMLVRRGGGGRNEKKKEGSIFISISCFSKGKRCFIRKKKTHTKENYKYMAIFYWFDQCLNNFNTCWWVSKQSLMLRWHI